MFVKAASVASVLLCTAHRAAGFMGLSGFRAAGSAVTQQQQHRNQVLSGRQHHYRQTARMSSTVPPQSDRQPNLTGGDFDSWFWGDAHVRGGVEHAVFKNTESAVVLFDGECNFCNSSVWMMIANSDARNMRFCAQNTEMGMSLLHSFGQDAEKLSSIAVLDKDGHLYAQSAAVVEILSRMSMPYPALSVLLRAVPEPLRDAGYSWVSRNRHAFGTENMLCRIPEDDEASRFLL